MSSPIAQRESHNRKSKMNHSFLKKRYAENDYEEQVQQNEKHQVPLQTPAPKMIVKEFSSSEKPKRSNSEDLEGLQAFFDDLPTASNSIQVNERKELSALLNFDDPLQNIREGEKEDEEES